MPRGFGECRIGFGPTTGFVTQLAVACDYLVNRDLPGLGRCSSQHLFDSGTGDPHPVGAGGANTQAAARHLQVKGLGGAHENAIHGGDHEIGYVDIAEQHAFCERVVGELTDGRGFLEFDEVPVGIELIGEHLGERRTDTLAHFRVRDDGGDDVIAIEFHPRMNQGFSVSRHVWGQLTGAMARANRNTHNDPTADHSAGRDKRASSPLIHRTPPSWVASSVASLVARSEPALAAVLIAALIRPYIPQRQMLPSIAVSMSSSVGFGLLSSRAAADMSCPDWQYPHCGT